MLPGMVGAVKHSSGLVRVWPTGAHEKEDERDDAWGAVAASEEEGEGDDGDGGDGELELLLGEAAAGVGEAVVDLDVGSGGASHGGDGAAPLVPDPVALPAVPFPGAARFAHTGSHNPWWEDVLL